LEISPDYQELLSALNSAEDSRHEVVGRFREKSARTKGFNLEFDILDPLFEEWSAADASVAAAREAIRVYIRRGSPRYTR
jgi:hypothetical protein